MGRTVSRTPDEIRELRSRHPEMRERDFARIHAISEAELVAAYVGRGVVRLRPDVSALLEGLAPVGTVMALTRNESAVHEKIGPYDNVHAAAHVAMTLGEIDLRIFPKRWAFGFSVEKPGEDGPRHSLQYFDREGRAVHKVHLRPESDVAAFKALVATLHADDQSPSIELGSREVPATAGPPAGRDELRAHWDRLTDTHQFFGMLRKLNLTRHQAVTLIDRDYAWPLAADQVEALMHQAAVNALPIMVFVGNPGCIQIHHGPIRNVSPIGPWLNVLDETFHLHLRLDHIAEVWAVRKPVAGGHVTSIEVFDAAGEMIIQFFGVRKEGVDERAEWRQLVESLHRRQETTAA